MMSREKLLIGYDLNRWIAYGEKEPLTIDVSPSENSHLLVAGISGTGKSYTILWHLSLLQQLYGKDCCIYFLDFKQEDIYSFLRGCKRYYPYDKTINALDEVYSILHSRQAGKDKSRNPIILIWDEYAANISAIQQTDKKKAEKILAKVSEILFLGRSLNVRLYTGVQRADAAFFPSGSRMNYGVVILLGAPIRSLYEMFLFKEQIEEIGNREFRKGEGVVLLQGSKLKYIKIPTVRDIDKMRRYCIDALS